MEAQAIAAQALKPLQLELKMGDKGRDKLTGLVGIVTGRSEYLFGCRHLLLQPAETKDGKPIEGTWMDEDRVELLEAGAVKQPGSSDDRRGGPMTNPLPPQ